ncbi:hypothetical protein Droror1_Dr00027905 [Drosera rotundifolia]
MVVCLFNLSSVELVSPLFVVFKLVHNSSACTYHCSDGGKHWEFCCSIHGVTQYVWLLIWRPWALAENLAGPDPLAIENFALVTKYPSVNIIGQDLFSSGIIKSATDFQVYKEIGGLSGLDFACTDHTAVYHTKEIRRS